MAASQVFQAGDNVNIDRSGFATVLNCIDNDFEQLGFQDIYQLFKGQKKNRVKHMMHSIARNIGGAASKNNILQNVLSLGNGAFKDKRKTFRSEGKECITPRELNRILRESTKLYKQLAQVEERLKVNCFSYGLQFRGVTPGNGDCFFEAVSSQLSRLDLPRRSPTNLRKSVANFLKQNRTYEGVDGLISLDEFVDEDFDDYCETLSRRGVYADHVAVFGMARMLKNDIVIVTSSPNTGLDQSLTWVTGHKNFKGEPILLGHFWEYHYQSLQPIYIDYSTSSQ